MLRLDQIAVMLHVSIAFVVTESRMGRLSTFGAKSDRHVSTEACSRWRITRADAIAAAAKRLERERWNAYKKTLVERIAKSQGEFDLN